MRTHSSGHVCNRHENSVLYRMKSENFSIFVFRFSRVILRLRYNDTAPMDPERRHPSTLYLHLHQEQELCPSEDR